MKGAIVAREHICSLAICVVQQLLHPRYRLDVVGRRLHSSAYYLARCGLRAAFMWLCSKSDMIGDHVLYHATVVVSNHIHNRHEKSQTRITMNPTYYTKIIFALRL